MFECIFVFDLFAVICAWLILSGENYKKNYAKSKIKISIIKLNNIKYLIKNFQNSCISGVSCCIFVFQVEDDFQNKKETFKPKNQIKIINN